jgi:hypothetical protein
MQNDERLIRWEKYALYVNKAIPESYLILGMTL